MVSCILTESGVVVGATVQLETVVGLAVEGIVISLDRKAQIMVLHTEEPRALIRIFNAGHLKSLKLVKSPEEHDIQFANHKKDHFTSRTPLPNRGMERVEKTVSEVGPLLMKTSNISIGGQQAYLQLKRTIDDTRWSGEDIRVLGLVVVAKPYGVDNVTKDAKATGYDDVRATTAMAQVQKILSKPFTEYKKRHPLDFTARAVAAK